ncbi:hypothetical protein NL676_007326 [Syzygium grande]|nr:hypothetical protein NL676_007326 [Syzygium grande]
MLGTPDFLQYNTPLIGQARWSSDEVDISPPPASVKYAGRVGIGMVVLWLPSIKTTEAMPFADLSSAVQLAAVPPRRRRTSPPRLADVAATVAHRSKPSRPTDQPPAPPEPPPCPRPSLERAAP